MSYLTWKLNLGIEVTWSLILIVLVSFICNLLDAKYTCLAYVIALIYLLDCTLIFFKVKTTAYLLPYSQFIVLVGGLHMVEGILTMLFGHKDSQCVITYQEDKIAGGYQAYRRWVFPLLLFVINGIYIPIVVIMVYMNTTLTVSPKQKAKKTGRIILLYGLIICLLGYMVMKKMIWLGIGTLAMPMLHELLFVIDTYWESKTPRYTYPNKGVRILEINNKQYGKEMSRGDIILTINGIEINEVEQYYGQLEKRNEKIVLEIETLNKSYKRITYTPLQLSSAQIVLLPRQ